MRCYSRLYTGGSTPTRRAANADTLICRGTTGGGAGRRAGRGQEPHTACDIHPREALRDHPTVPGSASGRSRQRRIGAGCNLAHRGRKAHAFPMARIVPDKTARSAAWIAVPHVLRASRPGPRSASRTTTAPSPPRHAEPRERLGMATYFADPYPSYRRGGNENRNGAIHRHLPKRTRHRTVHGRRDTGHRRSTTVPCACSPLHSPRHSPTNCHH